jgi:hypothetical protein
MGWNQVHYYCGHFRPIVSDLDDGDDWGAASGMNEWQKKPKYSEEACPNVAIPLIT